MHHPEPYVWTRPPPFPRTILKYVERQQTTVSVMVLSLGLGGKLEIGKLEAGSVAKTTNQIPRNIRGIPSPFFAGSIFPRRQQRTQLAQRSQPVPPLLSVQPPERCQSGGANAGTHSFFLVSRRQTGNPPESGHRGGLRNHLCDFGILLNLKICKLQ